MLGRMGGCGASVSASERKRRTFKHFKDICRQDKARIWSCLSYMCHIRSTAAWAFALLLVWSWVDGPRKVPSWDRRRSCSVHGSESPFLIALTCTTSCQIQASDIKIENLKLAI